MKRANITSLAFSPFLFVLVLLPSAALLPVTFSALSRTPPVGAPSRQQNCAKEKSSFLSLSVTVKRK